MTGVALHLMPKKSLIAKIRSRLPRLRKKRPPKKHILGIDAMDDFRYRVQSYEIRTILDVGANKGQSALEFRKEWPNARIHCFEPFEYAYQLLLENTKDLNVICHKIALGASKGYVDVQISDADKNSTRNSILPTNNIHDPAHLKTERIQMTTLSDFCTQHAIPFVDWLKIDTEGYDLEVLKGATSLLESSSILCIQTEVSMNARNKYHVGFHTMQDYLDKYNYLLFGIYNQVQEWKPWRPVLRRSDALFISEKLTTTEKLKSYIDGGEK